VSRWIEKFESHPFQATWKNLKTIVVELKVDDKTIITSVKEVARLQKVVSYIDGMINSIDPELVPMPTWDSFNSQATACLQQMQYFISNRNIAHVTQANEHIDNLLTYVRPYMVIEGRTGKILQDSIKRYSKTVDEYIKSFRDVSSQLVSEIKILNTEGSENLNQILSTKSSIDSFNSKLFQNSESAESIETTINNLVEDFEAKHKSLTQFYNEVFVGSETDLSTKKSISEIKEAVSNDQKEIIELLESVKTDIKDLEKAHLKIFGEPNEKGEFKGGLEAEIDTQKIRYLALNKEIESSLPGAISAGLASAYNQMKDSFDSPIKYANYLFYSCIALLVCVSFFQNLSYVKGEWAFNLINEWDVILRGIINKIPLYGAIVWLALYASKRRSEFQRLQQEYAHKEALAKSYHSYKKQLQDLNEGATDLQKALIEKAIDAIAYNASSTLDGKHGDKMPFLNTFENLIVKSTDKVLDAVKTIKS
jgi:hypothetical protein